MQVSTAIEFLNNNADKIWTLIATFVGALISYKATTAAEIRKEKRTAKLERIKVILIPLCNATEEAIESIELLNSIEPQEFDFQIKKPSSYLKTEKRVYLSDNQRGILQKYDKTMKEFYQTIKNEQNMVISDYEKQIGKEFLSNPFIIGAISINIEMSVDASVIRKMILEKEVCSLKEYVTGVSYIMNDDDNNYRENSFPFNDSIKIWYEKIQCNINTMDDIKDEIDRLTCEMYDFLWTIDDNSIIREIINGTTTKDKLVELKQIAERLKGSLLNGINGVVKG